MARVNQQGRCTGFIVGVASAAVVLGVGLVGCTSSVAQPTASVTPSETPTAIPTPTQTAEPVPTLRPQLSASANLAYFDFIASGVLAANPAADGRSFIDALVVGGFDKTQMEVTFDRTVIDLAADSIQFAVRFNGKCLIGQYGPASGGYHSTVAPILGTGTCLVGSTRQIDW